MRMKRHAIAAALLAALTIAVSAQGVQRCESPDGKVTYSNTRCPDGTSAVRQVNTSPPVTVEDASAAKERARTDAARVRDLEKAQQDGEAKARKAAEQKQQADAKSEAAAKAKERDRCERARRELAQARDARADLMEKRAASIEQMQKADRDVARREAALKGCPAAAS